MLAKLEKLLNTVGAFCVAMIFVLSTMQVVMRYWYGQTYFFTEEMARFFLVWAAMCGVAIETRRHGHIRISFIVERFPPRFRQFWNNTVEALVLLLFVVLAWLGVDSTIFNHGQESPGMQIPLSIPFSAIPIFFSFSALFMLERLLGRGKSDK
jgi:TRAP-type C4-dicarboxylate transport system permease small subunit